MSSETCSWTHFHVRLCRTALNLHLRLKKLLVGKGVPHSTIELHQGDFLRSERVREVLPQTDFVFVNNYVFGQELNDQITENLLVLLPVGAKVYIARHYCVCIYIYDTCIYCMYILREKKREGP